MKSALYTSITLLLVLVSGCQKDFLDRVPQDSISTEVFFKTEEDLQLYTNGLLSIPSAWGLYLADQGSDNAATTGAVEIKTIMTGNPTSQNLTSGWDWGRLRSINFFLDNYERAAVSAAVRDHYAGLARLYRAEFYFDKIKRYSDVPWYDHVLSTADEDELYKTQDSREMVVSNMMDDLQFAADHIWEEVPTGTPGKWVAVLIQARIALYEGTFRKYHPELNLEGTANEFLTIARDAAKKIMDSGMFSIYSTGNPAEDYYQLFVSGDLSGNPEVILSNIYDYSKSRNAGYRYEIQDYEQSPSRDLIQSYLMADGTPFTDLTGYETMQFVQEFQNRDPRLSQTMAYPGWINLADRQSTPNIQELNKNFTGYTMIKGFVNSTEQSEYESVDLPVLRYAEVLLTYAEATAELGTLTQSDLDNTVNVLRDRVGMPHLDMALANGNPDPFQLSKYPDVTGNNRGVILEIRRERRIEFALEGRRFDDLMRWHAGKLLEVKPVGMYFPGLGRYDLTGDGVPDIILISQAESIPDGDQKETNSLGAKLVYYKAGFIDDDVTVFLENGADGGQIVTEKLDRVFAEPRDYYRPIPFSETLLNPNLVQPFGWN